MKIHLDTDIGGDIDDLAALMMLLKWQGVELCGVTTMTEDKGKRAGFVKYVLQLAERMDIPVRAGADIAGGYYSYAPGFQGETYWSEPIVPVQNPLDEALELLKASIEKNAVIVSTGQFTNLYLLAKKYPGILQSANLFLMGGSVFPSREGYPEPGNANDYNIQLDVTSAKYVFEHSNPTLVTLAVTLETYLRQAYLPDIRKAGRLGELMARQAETFLREERFDEKYGKVYRNVPDDIINFLYDPACCAIALGFDERVEITEVPLTFEIENGLLVERVDARGKRTKVVTRLDGDAFSEFWFEVVRKRQADGDEYIAESG